MATVPTLKASEIFAMLEAQGYRCAYTGRELTPETASMDHLVPVSKGGSHTAGNLRIVHFKANLAKGTMEYEEFIRLCREIVQHHDAQA